MSQFVQLSFCHAHRMQRSAGWRIAWLGTKLKRFVFYIIKFFLSLSNLFYFTESSHNQACQGLFLQSHVDRMSKYRSRDDNIVYQKNQNLRKFFSIP